MNHHDTTLFATRAPTPRGLRTGRVLLLALLLASIPFVSRAQEAGESIYPDLRPAGFLQQHFVADETEGEPIRFSIHRARLGAAGPVTERIRVNVVGGALEPPNRTPRLVNAFVDVDVHPLLQIRTGQFLVPFGLEGPEPIPLNPAIERSTATRRLNVFTMFRDVGVQLGGSAGAVRYAAAIVNGTGANLAEEVDAKDVLGRIGVGQSGLEVGVSGHYGRRTVEAASPDERKLLRLGADARYRTSSVHLRAEYIQRRDEQFGAGDHVQHGGCLLGGYRVAGSWELIARVEAHDPDVDREDDRFTALTLGANYYVTGHTRVSVNYEIRDDQRDAVDLGNVLWIQMQVVL